MHTPTDSLQKRSVLTFSPLVGSDGAGTAKPKFQPVTADSVVFAPVDEPPLNDDYRGTGACLRIGCPPPPRTHTHTHTHTNKHTHTNTHKHTHTNTHKHTHTHTPARPPCNIRWHARTIARCRCTPASASQLSACAVFSPFFLRTPCIRGPTCGTRQEDWNILHVLHVLSQGRRIFSVPGIDQEPDGENRVDATWHSVSRRPQGAILSATMNDNMLFAFCFCDSTFQCWARSQASRERGSIPLAVACCCCLF
jgi:hypothetical protein